MNLYAYAVSPHWLREDAPVFLDESLQLIYYLTRRNARFDCLL